MQEAGHGRAIVLKPSASPLRYAWLCAVWGPAFTECLHEFLAGERARHERDPTIYRDMDAQGDLPAGAAFVFALAKGLRVDGLVFDGETYIDIGTPADLTRAVALYTGREMGAGP